MHDPADRRDERSGMRPGRQRGGSVTAKRDQDARHHEQGDERNQETRVQEAHLAGHFVQRGQVGGPRELQRIEGDAVGDQPDAGRDAVAAVVGELGPLASSPHGHDGARERQPAVG